MENLENTKEKEIILNNVVMPPANLADTKDTVQVPQEDNLRVNTTVIEGLDVLFDDEEELTEHTQHSGTDFTKIIEQALKPENEITVQELFKEESPSSETHNPILEDLFLEEPTPPKNITLPKVGTIVTKSTEDSLEIHVKGEEGTVKALDAEEAYMQKEKEIVLPKSAVIEKTKEVLLPEKEEMEITLTEEYLVTEGKHSQGIVINEQKIQENIPAHTIDRKIMEKKEEESLEKLFAPVEVSPNNTNSSPSNNTPIKESIIKTPVPEKEEDSKPFEMLDTLDAMIDTMIASPVASEENAISNDKIPSIPEDILVLLYNRIENLEEKVAEQEAQIHKEQERRIKENTKDDTANPHIKAIEELMDMINERVVVLEGQYSIICKDIEEINTHLQSLLNIPKRLSQIEGMVDIFSEEKTTMPVIEPIEPRIVAMEEKIQEVLSSLCAIEEMQEKMLILPVMEKRAEEIEQKVTVLSEQELLRKEEYTTLHTMVQEEIEIKRSIEEHLGETHSLTEDISAILTKLEQLENAIEGICSKQEAIEIAHAEYIRENSLEKSLEELQIRLMPTIEKGAISAASRIIKEELQAVLSLE